MKVLATALLAAALLPRAFAAEPLPDQPGALSPAEIQAATEAMKSNLGGEPAPQLLASGKRHPGHSMPSYALFATPLADFSDRVKTRRRIICNVFGGASGIWRCSMPHDEFRMSANGLEHVFSYEVVKGSGNKQTALDVVDFMYSRCYGVQFAAIGGKPFTPSPDSDYVNTVLDDGQGLNVATGPLGDGDSYRLEKTDKKLDNCGFRIQHARMARSGIMLPESYAKEQEKIRQESKAELKRRQAADEAAREARAAQQARAGALGKLAEQGLLAAMLCAVAAIIVPWIGKLIGPRFSAVSAGVLAAVATIVFVLAEMYLPSFKIRLDLLIIPPLLLLAWLSFVGFGYRALDDFRDGIGRRVMSGILTVMAILLLLMLVAFVAMFFLV